MWVWRSEDFVELLLSFNIAMDSRDCAQLSSLESGEGACTSWAVFQAKGFFAKAKENENQNYDLIFMFGIKSLKAGQEPLSTEAKTNQKAKQMLLYLLP